MGVLEILGYYLIAALSFSIMYTYSYGYEISKTVMGVLIICEIEPEDYIEDQGWGPNIYIGASFVMSFLVMPIYLYAMLSTNKWVFVSDRACEILEKSYGLEKVPEEEN